MSKLVLNGAVTLAEFRASPRLLGLPNSFLPPREGY